MSAEDLQAPRILTLPGLELLGPLLPPFHVDRESLHRQAATIETTLEQFSASAQVREIKLGPVFTSFRAEPAPGVRLRQLEALAGDLARGLSVREVEVQALPGEPLVGIQIPNETRRPVVLAELIGSLAFADADGVLPIVFGVSTDGEPVVADLADLPHLIIMGIGASGKSAAVHGILQSLLFRFGTARLSLLLIDSKAAEYATYDAIPHLLAPVVSDADRAAGSLRWVSAQMEHRYQLLRTVGARSFDGYNDLVEQAHTKGHPLEWTAPEGGEPTILWRTARIVVVIDAIDQIWADDGWPSDIQTILHRGAAVGIHLVLVGRQISTRHIEALLRQGPLARLSQRLATTGESRALLGEPGGETLLAVGDALLKSDERPAIRIHGALVVEDELQAVGNHWRTQGDPFYGTQVLESETEEEEVLSPEDQLYARAVAVVMDNAKASTSLVQRKLLIGYNSASRLVERMEREGLVGAPNHVGMRQILKGPRADVETPAVNQQSKSWMPWRR